MKDHVAAKRKHPIAGYDLWSQQKSLANQTIINNWVVSTYSSYKC